VHREEALRHFVKERVRLLLFFASLPFDKEWMRPLLLLQECSAKGTVLGQVVASRCRRWGACESKRGEGS